MRFIIVVIGLMVVAVAGCSGSTSPRVYQLSSLKADVAIPTVNSPGDRITVAIGPLRIPDYLNRPQIVTRSDDNELRPAELDRWAGPLEKDIVSALVENISALLPSDRFFVAPWKSASQAAAPSLYRVEINIVRFEGVQGDSVVLKAQWAIIHREEGTLLRGESIKREKVSDSSYGSVVAALSKTIVGLSRDISDTILTFQRA